MVTASCASLVLSPSLLARNVVQQLLAAYSRRTHCALLLVDCLLDANAIGSVVISCCERIISKWPVSSSLDSCRSPVIARANARLGSRFFTFRVSATTVITTAKQYAQHAIVSGAGIRIRARAGTRRIPVSRGQPACPSIAAEVCRGDAPAP